MKIIYVNSGVKKYMNKDHRGYIRNFCSCEKEAYKKFWINGIRTLELCDAGAALYQLS